MSEPTKLQDKTWEELAIRWGQQLSEVVRAFNRTFDTNLHTCKGCDNPSDIIETIALKSPLQEPDDE